MDPRWVHPFKLVSVGYIPTMDREPRFPGQIPRTQLRASALTSLASASAEYVSFSTSKKEVSDHADFKVDTGRHTVYQPDAPQFANAKWRVPPNVDLESAVAAWVELQHAVIETIAALHAVIVTATNPYVMSAERWLSLTSVDDTVMHPHPEEISAYARKRDQLGKEYVRKPRWGTYLKPAHVAAVGGREKILAVVKPPVVRDVGDLLYVQLSERVSDATSEAAKARWQAFADLLAPITVPMHG
ncbi:MAG: hypothetical protein ABI704_03630 [Kofleriaceae bacterium]